MNDDGKSFPTAKNLAAFPPANLDELDRVEWLEADGLGGFASGTVSGIRTRRYHALLLVARHPPVDRIVLVSGMDVYATTPSGRYALSSQRYAGGANPVVHPDGRTRLIAFHATPWPRFRFRLDDGIEIIEEIFVAQARGRQPRTVIRFHLPEPTNHVRLSLRPFLCGRDHHALHHENPLFHFDPERQGKRLRFTPYPDVPPVVIDSNGDYEQEPQWYRNFLYAEERDRGLDHVEDLASPGSFQFDLSAGDAVMILGAEDDSSTTTVMSVMREADGLSALELARRGDFRSTLEQAGDAFVVERGQGKSIIAGYPWFTDWGRDTFISVRGLCLATGRLDDARRILVAWAAAVSEGMLPNRYSDENCAAEYNSVDASLWFVVVARELVVAFAKARRTLPPEDLATLDVASQQILEGYARGTRHCIRLDEDGLIAAGEVGFALTWMDARVGDWVVTPRVGKPVEIQALWVNALAAAVAAGHGARWEKTLALARENFVRRFYDEKHQRLHDVVDVDHVHGTVDASFRPNQIFALGGLPESLLDAARARPILDAIEAQLVTPLGLRTLAPDDPRYIAHYTGDVRARDGAYHQGTVWPWLLGPFVEAWVRVRGADSNARAEARDRFLDPLLAAHLTVAGGPQNAMTIHLPEIADGASPHTPRGCPAQAWSVAEALRLSLAVLAEHGPASSGSSQAFHGERLKSG